MPDPILWTLIIVCLFLSAFFSATETAFATYNKFRMKVKADDGSRTAKLVCKVTEKFDRTLVTVLIGNNLVAIAVSAMSTVLFLKYFTAIGLEAYASVASTAIMTLVVYILGDTFPKALAKAIPDKLVYITVYPIYVLYIIVWPIAFLFDISRIGLSKLFKIKEAPTMTEEDFSNYIDSVEEEGVIEEEESDIIKSALDFTDTTALQVFTPLDKMFAIDITGLTHEKLNRILLSTKYSRIPVYEKDINNIIGVLNVKTYLNAYLRDNSTPIRESLLSVYFINPNIMIDDLLEGFKKNHTHIAIIKNSKNKVIGMITMEDILEEIVGAIAEPVSSSKSKTEGGKNNA